MGINKLVRGKKSRLELLYPELYTLLQLQRPKEIKQGALPYHLQSRDTWEYGNSLLNIIRVRQNFSKMSHLH